MGFPLVLKYNPCCPALCYYPARLLIDLIDQRIIHLVLATSTLSEGVNLPFETVLIPNLQRWDNDRNCNVNISIRDFANLVGRAGRPGFGTEGRCLVLMSNFQSSLRRHYNSLDLLHKY